jgi:hypothetical protein
MSSAITRPARGRYYALLFAGDTTHAWFGPGLARWAKLLIEMYGYEPQHVRVLVGPPATPPPSLPPGTIVTYGATMTDFDAALANYAGAPGPYPQLGPADSLFILTIGHGGYNACGPYQAFLSCHGSPYAVYWANQFASRIQAIHSRQIALVAAQSCAAGFVDSFIQALAPGTRGAGAAACLHQQASTRDVFEKVFASVLNGRMVQDPLDDNIDLGITGGGMGPTFVPGFHTNRFDWGPNGVISMREAHSAVYDHYVTSIYPNPAYNFITETLMYRQKPEVDGSQPAYVRLGEPDLIMQDCPLDSGLEPSAAAPPPNDVVAIPIDMQAAQQGSTAKAAESTPGRAFDCPNFWYSPDLLVDNPVPPGGGCFTPGAHNRFFLRTANRGTAPTDDIWRILKVASYGALHSPLPSPMRIDRAVVDSVTPPVSARLRPGRAHTQREKVWVSPDTAHACLVAASFCPLDPLDYALFNPRWDNDQAQHNLSPVFISGDEVITDTTGSSNARMAYRRIPVVAPADGEFSLRLGDVRGTMKVQIRVDPPTVRLKKGENGAFVIAVAIPPGTARDAEGVLDVGIIWTPARDGAAADMLSGVSMRFAVCTSHVVADVHGPDGHPAAKAKVLLTQPDDPRELTAVTDNKGVAAFGPLNPGFYFLSTPGSTRDPMPVHAVAGRKVNVRFFLGPVPVPGPREDPRRPKE